MCLQRTQPAGAGMQPAGSVPVKPRDEPEVPGPGVDVPAGHLRVLSRRSQEAPGGGHPLHEGETSAKVWSRKEQ